MPGATGHIPELMSQIVTKLRHWITQLTERRPGEALTSIHHKLDLPLLVEAHRQLGGSKAPGIDGVRKADYEEGLERKLQGLLDQVRSQSYRAPAVRRVDIPKPDGKTRPLGVPTHEDKVLQKAFVLLVEPVFEKEFSEGSFGYRPKRTQHDAIRALDSALGEGHHSIIELDIKGYFDSIPHAKLQEMFRHRISDSVLNRLVLGWLKAGVLKEGQWQASEAGTPQGGVVSPLLANLYLHEVLDTWLEKDVKPRLTGGVKLVRYADDAVICFQSPADAQRVYRVLKQRFEKFGLTLHPEKTRLTDFRPPVQGQTKGATFSFLGFTFYWGRSRRGKWVPKPKTEGKRLSRKLKEIGEWCRQNRHRPIAEQQAALRQKVQGHIDYYGVSHNFEALQRIERGVLRVWRKWLNRRGSPKRITLSPAWDALRARRPWVRLRIKHKLGKPSPSGPVQGMLF
jgi:group II intron reverse transcriptase/maturase